MRPDREPTGDPSTRAAAEYRKPALGEREMMTMTMTTSRWKRGRYKPTVRETAAQLACRVYFVKG